MGAAERAARKQQQDRAASAATAKVARAADEDIARRQYEDDLIAQVEALAPKALAALGSVNWCNGELIKVGPFGRKRAAWPISWGKSARGTDTGLEFGEYIELWLLSDGRFVQNATTSPRSFRACLRRPPSPPWYQRDSSVWRPYRGVPDKLRAMIKDPTRLPTP